MSDSQSISQVVYDVSQMFSSLEVKSSDAMELSQCLPWLQIILSEIGNMVSMTITQEKQPTNQNPDDELLWDASQDFVVYPDTHSSSFSMSASSSDISSDSNSSIDDQEAEERHLLQEIFVDTMVEAINRAAPNAVFNGEKSRENMTLNWATQV